MRPLFILLALAPLAVRADCPSILEGLDPNITIVPVRVHTKFVFLSEKFRVALLCFISR